MLSDKRKLILTLFLLLCAGFTVTTLVNYHVSKASIRESIIASELPLTSDNLYSEIQKDLIRPILISSMMASDTFLRDWVLAGEQDTDRITRYLREVKERYGAFTSFFISEKTRTYYQTEGILKQMREDDPRDVWYFRVRRMKEPYEINLDPDLANRDALTIFINYRVHDYAGGYIGAAGVGLTVDSVCALINEYQRRYRRNIYFVDRSGTIALFANDAAASGSRIQSIGGLGAIADRILQEGSGSYEYRNGGRGYLLNVRFIPELNWHLFVERVEDEALADIRHTLYANLALSIAITLIVLLATSYTISRYQGRLEKMAIADSLTGLANRRAFDLLVPQAIRDAQRSRAPLLAIMIDIDRFKEINDRHGHLAGDGVLRKVAAIIRETVRKSDIVCRWGGEEFLVVAKGVDEAQGEALAEKIRGAVEAGDFSYKGTAIPVTVSLGIAARVEHDAPDGLIARADRALYEAKARGRNLVHAA
jgi:diguanylate cyclase (GGDEF)-like protein